jgi:hypothetical protein
MLVLVAVAAIAARSRIPEVTIELAGHVTSINGI